MLASSIVGFRDELDSEEPVGKGVDWALLVVVFYFSLISSLMLLKVKVQIHVHLNADYMYTSVFFFKKCCKCHVKKFWYICFSKLIIELNAGSYGK